MALKDGVVIAETTFADLEFKPEIDRSGLASAKLYLARLKSPLTEGVVYLGISQRGLFGNLIAQTINDVTPFKNSGIDGTRDDLRLPDMANEDRKSYKKYGREGESYWMELDRHHREDERIGPHYINFDLSGSRLDWLKAFGQSSADKLFEGLGRIHLINHQTVYQDTESLLVDRLGIELSKLLGQERSPRLTEISQRLYRDLLNGEEAQKAAINYWIRRSFAVLDIGNQQSYQKDPPDYKLEVKASINFIDNQEVEISYPMSMPNRSAVVKLRFSDNNGDYAGFDLLSVNREADYYDIAIYPLFAWVNNNGARHFLSPEVTKAVIRSRKKVREIPNIKRGEVYLGRVMTGHLLQGQVEKWNENYKMRLSQRPEEQTLMSAQMPVWFSLENHAQEVLSEEAGLFPAMERAVDKAA